MNKYRTIAVAVVALMIGAIAAPISMASAKGDKNIEYTFEFANGQVISGVADNNNAFIAEAGGTDANNPTGMTVHVSCSDKFPDGWGDKEGPDPRADSAWQITSYFIQKGDKTCGAPIEIPEDPCEADVDIEVWTNGQDADNTPGPLLELGEEAEWKYRVTNTGDCTLTNVWVVEKAFGHQVVCYSDQLEVGEKLRCFERFDAEAHPYEDPFENDGVVWAKDPEGNWVSDADPSHYHTGPDGS